MGTRMRRTMTSISALHLGFMTGCAASRVPFDLSAKAAAAVRNSRRETLQLAIVIPLGASHECLQIPSNDVHHPIRIGDASRIVVVSKHVRPKGEHTSIVAL